jgi:hypothetical protein
MKDDVARKYHEPIGKDFFEAELVSTEMSREEQIRSWALDAASRTFAGSKLHDNTMVLRHAKAYEAFIKTGETETD